MKRTAAVALATASLLWTCAWATYLLYFGFTDWVPDDSDGDSISFAITFLVVVTTIPLGGALLGWIGARSWRGSGTTVWIGTGVLALFFFSPGLFGVPYLLSALLMGAAAAVRSHAMASTGTA